MFVCECLVSWETPAGVVCKKQMPQTALLTSHYVAEFISEGRKKVTEHLLTLATAEAGDAGTLTDTKLEDTSKGRAQRCKNIESVLCLGEVQKRLEDRLLGREISHIHSFDRQLHLEVIHALSAEEANGGFFNVCAML